MKTTSKEETLLKSYGIATTGKIQSAWMNAYIEGRLGDCPATKEARIAEICELQKKYVNKYVIRYDGLGGLALAVIVFSPIQHKNVFGSRLGLKVVLATGTIAMVAANQVELAVDQ